MRNKKIRQLGIPNLYIIGAGLLIVVLIGLFSYNYNNYRRTLISYTYDDLKVKYDVISDEDIYTFMNFTLFNAAKSLSDKRDFMKVTCFTIKHSSDLRKFIASQNENVLPGDDKRFMAFQTSNQSYLWDDDKLINVWSLTPKDLHRLDANDTIDFYDNFQALYGDNGKHSYSKPIFNRNKDIAVIERISQFGWLGGSRDILLFRKENENWRLIEKQNIWIS